MEKNYDTPHLGREKTLTEYSRKRLDGVIKGQNAKVKVEVGTEVYYPNKKLSNKSENYSAKFAHRYLGLAKLRRVLERMIVELHDPSDKALGKYYVRDQKIPRRSLRRILGAPPPIVHRSRMSAGQTISCPSGGGIVRPQYQRTVIRLFI